MALRKALLAAIVAVSAFVYNKAHAAELTNMKDDEKNVESLTETTDIQATLDNSTLNSKGAVSIGDPADNATESDTLTLKNASALISGGPLTINQNAVVSSSGLESAGNMQVNGTLTGNGANLKTTSGGNVVIDILAATETKYNTTEDLVVDSDNEFRNNSTGKELRLVDASINTGSHFIVGSADTADDANLLYFKGTGTTNVLTGGNLEVYQSLTVGPGLDEGETGAGTGLTSVGKATVTAEGFIKVKGNTFTVTEGIEKTGDTQTTNQTLFSAKSDIDVDASQAIKIAGDSLVKSDEGNVTLNALDENGETDGNVNMSGSVQAAQGFVKITSADNRLIGHGKYRASVSAKQQVEISIPAEAKAESRENVLHESDVSSTDSYASITGGTQATLAGSTVSAKTGAAVSSETVTVAGSSIKTEQGTASINATDENVTVSVSSVSNQTGNVTIAAQKLTMIEASSISGSAVNVSGQSNIICDESSMEADSGITVNSTGTLHPSADGATPGDGNLVSQATLTARSGDVLISAVLGNSVEKASKIKAEAGSVTLRGSTVNLITGDQTEIVANNGAVTMDGGDTAINQISGALITATDSDSSDDKKLGTVDIKGKTNVITNTEQVKAANGIAIKSTGTATNDGNLISNASVLNQNGDITVTAVSSNRVTAGSQLVSENGGAAIIGAQLNLVEGSDTQVKAVNGNATISAGETGTNIVNQATVQATGDNGEAHIKGKANGIIAGASLKGHAGVSLEATGTDESDGNLISASTVESHSGDVSVTAVHINRVTGNSTLQSENGAVSMVGNANVIEGKSKMLASKGITITADNAADGAGNRITDEGTVVSSTEDDVAILAKNANVVTNKATIEAGSGSITVGEKDSTCSSVDNYIANGAALKAKETITVAGAYNEITSANAATTDRTTLTAEKGIHVSNNSIIRHATLQATGENGTILITTGADEQTSTIDGAHLQAKGAITIKGDTSSRTDESNLAFLTGGTDLLIQSEGAGVTLDNVNVLNTGMENRNIIAMNDGDISILNRVDVQNGALTINEGARSSGRIVVNTDAVLNLKKDSTLAGRLSGNGAINKSGGDELLLDLDHTDYTGTIYANGAAGGPAGSAADVNNEGSWIMVTGAGVGTDAKMVLKNTDLIVATGETQIGTLDTTQDAQANNAATGGTLDEENLYTSDERMRADFRTIGSVIEVNKGTAGDVVHATDMKLSDATLLKLDVEVNNDDSVISDRIAATGTVNAAAATGLNSTSTATAPSTARVFANLDAAAAASAAEGARTTILTGTLAAPINEDVLYEVKKATNGTYQRTLQDRNMHLENKGDRVDLVFSKNYRSAAKTAPMQKVADAIRQYSDAFHHSEGWLAASDDRMAKLVDAFDYTRSEAAAQRGLQSLAGTGNVLPQLMLFDSSRHHLNQLRKQMEMPVCPRTWKGAPTRKSNAWLAYTGAYDSLNGDANMGDYTRSAHGAMMGVDTALTCKLRAGLSLGYETASGEADSAKVDADTIFVDAYATGRTGSLKHRASIGLALTSFDARRSVEVEAGYHSFHDSTRSDTDALTLNFGYEISSDYKLSERSWLTRYAAINLAWHNLDDMKESGLGEIGLVSEYDSEWQAGVAVGLAYNREFAAVKYEAPAVFSAHAAVHFELLADKATVNNRFSGLEGSWEAHSMDREQLYLELGVGVMVPLSPAWTATAGAAVEVGADRSAFSGNVGVRYAF